MHLTGNDAHWPGLWTLNKLVEFLEPKLAEEPFATKFANVGGINITTQHHQAKDWVERAKRPFIFLSLDEGDHQRTLWRVPVDISPAVRYGKRHSLVVIAELVTPQGTPTVQEMRDAVGDIFDRNFYPLHDLGLTEISFSPDPAREAQGSHVNPHSIGCEVYSL